MEYCIVKFGENQIKLIKIVSKRNRHRNFKLILYLKLAKRSYKENFRIVQWSVFGNVLVLVFLVVQYIHELAGTPTTWSFLVGINVTTCFLIKISNSTQFFARKRVKHSFA